MPAGTKDAIERFYAWNRAEWHDWLAAHRPTAPGVWLVYYKKESGRPRVAYDEAVEEALCFGWIDSTPNALDDERYMQLFSPRKPGSPWSKLNKERIERLLAAGLMAPTGLAAIEAARQDGSWNAYDAIEALTIPEDLTQALAANETARGHFAAFGSATKKHLLWWVASARRAETREKRIAALVDAAVQNINPLAYRPKGKS